ncbi:hypothetical protein [Emticicia sp. TH156]|uniref:hypothetical protein n=1 Tax=Emticicia sp. TH156 TaxID=2067454 RepID=UPI000C78D7F8|nr:hypothetical protein [Emticicia sp. TH156]PLK42107.1 hypothetical protein C0V77_22605 [Emticicia sp. TH156]
MNKIIIILLLSFCYGCVVPKIELTEQEKNLESKLKNEFACDDLEFRHDYHAIKENRKDAMFIVTLCDGFCNKDSLTIFKETIRLTKMIKPILSHRANYENVIFYTSLEKKKDETWSSLICNKTIKVSLRDLKVIEFSK